MMSECEAPCPLPKHSQLCIIIIILHDSFLCQSKIHYYNISNIRISVYIRSYSAKFISGICTNKKLDLQVIHTQNGLASTIYTK